VALQPIRISDTRLHIIILIGVRTAKETKGVKNAMNKGSRLARRLTVQAKAGMVDLTARSPFYQYVVVVTRGSEVY
jgi:hypothetical protein